MPPQPPPPPPPPGALAIIWLALSAPPPPPPPCPIGPAAPGVPTPIGRHRLAAESSPADAPPCRWRPREHGRRPRSRCRRSYLCRSRACLRFHRANSKAGLRRRPRRAALWTFSNSSRRGLPDLPCQIGP
ncbi:hypothetical protein DN745_15250 [Bradymonas sediminis]|uniref:Uncharacterized protein n=1 Tax=Bradymonas sediminis TaxID=1548548 RepID=A0A2Z4FNN5_9DELT|nr:hypothetical protein DN745_15250 [Bradymonas sediminis]